MYGRSLVDDNVFRLDDLIRLHNAVDWAVGEEAPASTNYMLRKIGGGWVVSWAAHFFGWKGYVRVSEVQKTFEESKTPLIDHLKISNATPECLVTLTPDQYESIRPFIRQGFGWNNTQLDHEQELTLTQQAEDDVRDRLGTQWDRVSIRLDTEETKGLTLIVAMLPKSVKVVQEKLKANPQKADKLFYRVNFVDLGESYKMYDTLDSYKLLIAK